MIVAGDKLCCRAWHCILEFLQLAVALPSALAAGRLGDSRVSRRLVLCTGAALAGLSVVLFSLCTSFAPLAFCTFLLGVGTGTVRPSVYSILMDIYPESYVARAMGIYLAGPPLGKGL